MSSQNIMYWDITKVSASMICLDCKPDNLSADTREEFLILSLNSIYDTFDAVVT